MFRRLFCYLLCMFHAQLMFAIAQNTDPCDEAHSCMSRNITNDDSDIECSGHYSCLDATLSTMTNGSSNVVCHGAHSCVNAMISTQGNNYLLCGGLFSCQNAAIYHSGARDVYCRGEGSCAGATINVTEEESSVYCQGYEACANSTMYIDSLVNFAGVSSGRNGTFYSSSNYTEFYFRAMYSGENATIYCKNGAECFIRCFTTGCNNLNVLCASGNSTSCALTISCAEGSDKSNLCSGTPPVDGVLVDWIELAEMNNEYSSSSGYSYSYNGILPPNINQIGTFSTRQNSLSNCTQELIFQNVEQ